MELNHDSNQGWTQAAGLTSRSTKAHEYACWYQMRCGLQELGTDDVSDAEGGKKGKPSQTLVDTKGS
jgi:hypothetical protein